VQEPPVASGGTLEQPPEQPFERAKLPMVIAAVVMVAGLAISGSLDKTPSRAGDPAPSVPFGGAIVLAAWVLGIGALHRLGRAGSMDRSENRSRSPATVDEATAPPPPPADAVDDDDSKPDDSKPKPD
jgi:hypothetical protein